MNDFSAYLLRSLRGAWRNGCGEEARRAALTTPFLFLAGFASAYFLPQLSGSLLRLLEQALASIDVGSGEAGNIATAIFANNLTAGFSAIIWGLVPFAYLSAFPLGFNFFLLGVMGAYYVQSGPGFGVFLVGVLPHGIFELPALVLFCAAGLYLCSRVTARVRGDKEVSIMQALADVSSLFLYVVLPLLAASSLIEAYVTPRLLELVL